MSTTNVSAVLFAKDLAKVTAFYEQVFAMTSTVADEYHSSLNCRGFNLIVHQIPKQFADHITIAQPPERRAEVPMRLDYPVRSVSDARRIACSLGGEIDEAPPGWAERNANFFLGCDPEGNVFGVTEAT
jgi:predicted enzyme related to lactoylglutathione lyase